MFSRRSLWLLTWTCNAGIAACATDTESEARQVVEDASSDGGNSEPPRRLEFRPLGAYCGHLRAEPGTRMIRDADELQETFEQAYPNEEFRPDPPVVDFEGKLVLEARWGENHVNNQYVVTSVLSRGDHVEVTLTFRTRCSDGDDEYYLCSLTEVPLFRDKQYRFRERLQIREPIAEHGVCPELGDPRVIGPE